jgi:molecular chaperone GrpE
MAKKKKEKNTDKNLNESNAGQEQTAASKNRPDNEQQSRDENMTDSNGAEKDVIATLHGDLAAANDKYLRLYSEFDNYRKRTLKERAELVSNANAGLITQLLPVLDDFERALAAFAISTDVDGLKQGMELIHEKFKKTLTQKGLEEIQSVGEVFDTDLHEAITNLPATDETQKGRVVDQVEKGYLLNGKVIRFAKVAVAN